MNSKGFSVIEVILAGAMFMTFATFAATAVLQGFGANRLGVEETIANQFAAEGIEAVKSIKNQAYTNLVNSPGTGIRRSVSNVWEFFGTDNILNSGKNYTRTIKIESVNRDGTGNIVTTGGTTDQDTKKITSTVNWNFNSARLESVVLTTYLSDWEKPISSVSGPTMMAYSKTTSTPFYRTWDGTNWNAEGNAQIVGGNINYIVLKSSDSRNEAILGTLAANGDIHVQIWNGSSWSTPRLMANVGATLASYRGFDIEYETSGNRAIVVYLPNSTSVDPAYQIWDGTAWDSTGTTITAPPTTGIVRWIELAANPTSSSNEIAMIMLDANVDVYGMVWSGSSWNNMGVSAVWDDTASTADRKSIDVAYEQTLGRAMFIWGDSVVARQNYRIWNGSALTVATPLDIPASAGVANWVRLVSRPSSNELLYGVQDAAADLNTRKWSGSAWDTATEHAEHDESVENIASMNFDLVWETHTANPGRAWLMWGNFSMGLVGKKQWTSGPPPSWGSVSSLTGSDNTPFIRLKADPSSGAIFAGLYEDFTNSATDDIWESRLTGGSSTWTAKNTIWDGGTAASQVFFRIDIATP